MAKADMEDFMSQYGNWNVAAEYSKLKIMKQLYLADEYETIAKFGFVEFADEFNTNVSIDPLRVKGLRRLINCLILIINNTKFAVRGKEKEQILGYLDTLKRYYKIIPKLYKYRTDQRKGTKEMIIDEENFDKVLSNVEKIKADINEPLNKYDLIFSHKEEFDPKAWKKAQIERLTNIG